MLKQFLTRKALEWRLRKSPPTQRQQILALVEKDPDLFAKISKEIQAEMKKGKDEQAAAMAIMPKYQQQLRAVIGVQRVPQRFNVNGSIRK